LSDEFDDTQNEMAPGLLRPELGPETPLRPAADADNPSSPLKRGEEMAPGLIYPKKGGKWSPARQREWMRGVIAIGLLICILMVLVTVLAALWYGKATMQELTSLMNLTFVPVITLLSAATGFYFGQRSASAR
jgi:hypothetical protein